MIVSRDEFLLLLQNWQNSSATVRFMMVHGESAQGDPLSTALLAVLAGRITRVDESQFVLAVGDTGIVSVGTEGATFEFKTVQDVEPPIAGMFEATGEVDEIVSICLSSGIRLLCVTLKK